MTIHKKLMICLLFVVGGREEILYFGVDKLEACNSVERTLSLQSSLVLDLPRMPNGYYSFPQRPVGLGVPGSTGSLEVWLIG